MCHICETGKLCQRLARQIKNIDDGGSVSLEAIREIMGAALVDLGRYHNAATASMAIMQGMATAEIVVVDRDKDEKPATCGAIH